MRNILKLLGIVTLTAVIGISLLSCDDGGEVADGPRYDYAGAILEDAVWQGYGFPPGHAAGVLSAPHSDSFDYIWEIIGIQDKASTNKKTGNNQDISQIMKILAENVAEITVVSAAITELETEGQVIVAWDVDDTSLSPEYYIMLIKAVEE